MRPSESVGESVLFLGLGGGVGERVAGAVAGRTSEHVSTEVGRGPAWGPGASAVFGCLYLGLVGAHSPEGGWSGG